MSMLDHVGLINNDQDVDALYCGDNKVWPPVAVEEPPAGWESFTPLDVSAGGSFLLRNDTNYLIRNQSSPLFVRLRGGRKVVIMGLTVNVDRPNSWYRESESKTTGLELQENPLPPTDPNRGGDPQPDREFYCEGVLLKGPSLTQGIRIACPTADVRLVNVHVAGVRFRDTDHRDGTRRNVINHPDLVQTYGGAKSLKFDGFTGYSSYQGLFFKEDNTIIGGPISLRRVDLHATETTDATGTSCAGHLMLRNYRNQPVTVADDTVWIQGHPRNGWQPRTDGSIAFHRVRVWNRDPGTGIFDYTTSTQLYNFDADMQGWEGLDGTVLAHETTQTYEGTGALSLSKTLAQYGYDSVRMADTINVRDISANGTSFSLWVYIPVGTPGANWKCRFGVYEPGPGYEFWEQDTGDLFYDITPGVWTECTWDLAETFYSDITGTTADSRILSNLRRIQVRVGGNNVNAPVTVYVDNFHQGNFTPETGNYSYDPVPSNGTDAMAISQGSDIETGAPNVTTDEQGQFASYTSGITGRIRLGKPGLREYVPAADVGNGYVRPT
ncbi:hypothetical protein CR983_02655 [Candidatus Saccharibacteria bacterium]|nr:MAG: hypothetical protein CR983_02655 [Candidatus Saccharibacteria bacterium]